MITIQGADEIIEMLEEMVDASKLSGAVDKACLLVEGEARRKAPRRTGNLRRSIESKVENNGDEIVGTIFTPLEYAPYVEYGTGLFATGTGGGRKDVPWVYYDEKHNQFVRTSGQTPQPYMRPALDENRDKIIDMIREGLCYD